MCVCVIWFFWLFPTSWCISGAQKGSCDILTVSQLSPSSSPDVVWHNIVRQHGEDRWVLLKHCNCPKGPQAHQMWRATQKKHSTYCTHDNIRRNVCVCVFMFYSTFILFFKNVHFRTAYRHCCNVFRSFALYYSADAIKLLLYTFAHVCQCKCVKLILLNNNNNKMSNYFSTQTKASLVPCQLLLIILLLIGLYIYK